MSCDDIILWPDGEWCFRHELEEMSWKSDDYKEIPVDTNEHTFIMNQCYSTKEA